MATPSAGDLRNFAIVGHASSGKTMLSEAMLACAGVIGRMGNIAQGTTVSDYHVSEKQHQISTQMSLMHCTWMNKKLNILDTPGYLDFMSEALAAVRVADFALVVVHAQHGIGVGTERVWNCATDCGIPKVIVINAVDKQNAHFDEVLVDARAHYGPKVFPLNVPINPGPNFNQVLDVLRNEVVTYETDGHGKFREEPATGEWKDRAAQLHRELIELIAESDDTLLNKFFEQGSLSEEEFRAGIHAAVQGQMFIPLFCTSAGSHSADIEFKDWVRVKNAEAFACAAEKKSVTLFGSVNIKSLVLPLKPKDSATGGLRIPLMGAVVTLVGQLFAAHAVAGDAAQQERILGRLSCYFGATKAQPAGILGPKTPLSIALLFRCQMAVW